MPRLNLAVMFGLIYFWLSAVGAKNAESLRARIGHATKTDASWTTLTATTTDTSIAMTTDVFDGPLKSAPSSVATLQTVYKRKLPPLIVGAGYPDFPITSVPARWYKRAAPSQSHDSSLESVVTATITVTSIVTVHVTETAATTSEVPATSTEVTTAAPTTKTETETETVTHYTSITVAHPAGTKTTTQDTTSAEPAATEIAFTSATYSKVELPASDCVYVDYYDLRPVKRNPAKDHEAGVRDCQKRCTEDARCKYFFVFRYDPEKAKGKSAVGCQLSSNPYDKNNVQCDYMSDFSVSYSKNEEEPIEE